MHSRQARLFCYVTSCLWLWLASCATQLRTGSDVKVQTSLDRSGSYVITYVTDVLQFWWRVRLTKFSAYWVTPHFPDPDSCHINQIQIATRSKAKHENEKLQHFLGIWWVMKSYNKFYCQTVADTYLLLSSKGRAAGRYFPLIYMTTFSLKTAAFLQIAKCDGWVRPI